MQSIPSFANGCRAAINLKFSLMPHPRRMLSLLYATQVKQRLLEEVTQWCNPSLVTAISCKCLAHSREGGHCKWVDGIIVWRRTNHLVNQADASEPSELRLITNIAAWLCSVDVKSAIGALSKPTSSPKACWLRSLFNADPCAVRVAILAYRLEWLWFRRIRCCWKGWFRRFLDN